MDKVELKQTAAVPGRQSAAAMQVGQVGKIVAVNTSDPQKLRKLMAMGVLPGTTLHLLQNYPSYVFQVGFAQIAVDRNIAGDIFVA